MSPGVSASTGILVVHAASAMAAAVVARLIDLGDVTAVRATGHPPATLPLDGVEVVVLAPCLGDPARAAVRRLVESARPRASVIELLDGAPGPPAVPADPSLLARRVQHALR